MSSREVTEAVGREGESLRDRAARLRGIAAAKSPQQEAAEELARVEAQIAAQDQAALTAEAERYILGEVRAISSLVKNETKLDGDRLLDAARKFADEVERTNERFVSIIGRRHSIRAVCEAFGLDVPDLPTVVVPALRKEVNEAFEITSRVGVRDNGYIQAATDGQGRRTFAEPEVNDGARALIQRKRAA